MSDKWQPKFYMDVVYCAAHEELWGHERGGMACVPDVRIEEVQAKWYCVRWERFMVGPLAEGECSPDRCCTPDDPHDGCHWAVEA